MRLCVVSGTFHPEPGGPATFLYHLLPALQRRGHSVEVVTYGEAYARAGYPFPVTRISRQQPIPLRLIDFTLAVLRAGRRNDVFFVSDYGLPVAVANLILMRPIALKNVGDFAWEFATRRNWIPAGETIDEFQARPGSRRVNFLRAIQRWYTRAAGVIIAPSRYSASLILGWGVDPSRVRVIYNALDPVNELPTRDSARRELRVAGPLFVTVARLTPWKGVAGVVRALARVRDRSPGARLIVVGDGPERPMLEREAARLGEAVSFVGVQPPDRVRLYVCAADAFVLFSTYEGLPHTVLEAMQCGVPVIVSDAGGNTEVVKDGETGWVVPTGDEWALAKAMLDVVASPALAAERARTAFQGLERFSWSRLVDDYDAALRALV